MERIDRIYKVFRSNLDATQTMELAKSLEPTFTEHDLKRIEIAIENSRATITSAKVAKPIDIQAVDLAEKLCKYITELRSYEKTNVNEYAKSIRLLHADNDLFTYDLIEVVMKWLFETYEPSGEFDWRDQIRSGMKFRKHFTRLLEQAKKHYVSSFIEEV